MVIGTGRNGVGEPVRWGHTDDWRPCPEALDVWRVDWVMDGAGAASEQTVDLWAEGLLDEAERGRAQRLVVAAKRRQFTRSRAALRVVLGWRLGVDPRGLEFRLADHGRPEVDGIVFNLSHSGTVAVIAVGATSTTKLGVDVERVETDRPVDRLVERFFAPSEADAFAQCPTDERAADFARRWALKEAYVKALGTGLTYSSRDFALQDDPVSWTARPLLASCARHGERLRDWRFRNLWLDVGPERFAVALCSDERGAVGDGGARTFRFDFPGERG